ncbi:LOW QUALITY PROTEIN: F-box only protein 43 isoform X2 [Cricetulus griseus]|uniref:F-box only protein 43 n=1 Tax=Cricetulus griseus TaxID=10029 RepID=A0A9J7GME7_CRIGR|nr:LOW QUALITY PROTEIN: F-box only protein 43 isoform X2 [Cricetulus griseus]
MSSRGEDERLLFLEACLPLTCLRNSRLTDESVKMSQRHSASHGAGGKVDSPAVTVRWPAPRDFCLASSFQQYRALSETCSSIRKEKDPALTCEHLETPSRGSAKPAVSPAQRRKPMFPRKEKGGSPELCETPKARRKPRSLRRRLDLSFTLLKADSDPQSASLENSVSRVLSPGKHTPDSASSFPKQDTFSPSAASTVDTEDATSRSQSCRLSFSQHKTSTIDDSAGDCGLFEVECLSPIRGDEFKGSATHDFSDSSLSVSDENTCPELLGFSGGSQTSSSGADVTTSVTPVSSLMSKIRFKGSQALSSSSAEARDSVSTPEDSGFSSLTWDKSEDSLSDQEGSLQELLQKHRGTPRAGDLIRKPKHPGRQRRLSTLREQGSQSETEDEKQMVPPKAATGTSGGQQRGPGEKNPTLDFKNLSNTPALQLVHELFVKSKRKRFPQADGQEFLEERDEGTIGRLQCVLAGLIGKKMGIEQLDILTELQYRNLKHVLAVVLASLTSESLYSAWNVSRNWREIVAQDKKANERRKLYIIQLKADAQATVLHVQEAGTRLRLLSRSALRSVQAQAQAQAPPSQKEQAPTLSPWGDVLTPVASSSLTHLRSKQDQYVKVARTLFSDEALKPCPRCQSPARYQPYKRRGLCSRLACGFDFCVLCLCAYHGSEECRGGPAKPRSSKEALPGSAQSKRNLKRL